MNLLLQTMKQHFPKLNINAYNFSDVERIARRENINLKLCNYDPEILGYYCARKTFRRVKKFIVINSRLDLIGKTFTGLHELAHYFLHVPVSARQYYFCRRNALNTQHKHDWEANAFALVAMIPKQLLIDLASNNFENIAPELVPFCLKRQEIYFNYEN